MELEQCCFNLDDRFLKLIKYFVDDGASELVQYCFKVTFGDLELIQCCFNVDDSALELV